MEDSLDAFGPRPLGHLRTETELLVVTVHDAGESGKTYGDHFSFVCESALDDLGLAALEHRCGIDELDGHLFGSSLGEDVLDPQQHLLPVHLVLDVQREKSEFLHSLDLDTCTAGDGDVQVLSDRSDTALDPLRGPEHGTYPESYLHAFLGCADVGSCRHFDERYTESVETIGDLGVGGLYLTARILLQTNREDGDLLAVDIYLPVGRDQSGPLES